MKPDDDMTVDCVTAVEREMAVNVDRTIEDMTAAGSFGQDSRIVSFKPEGLHTANDHFASCVVFGLATVDDLDGQLHSHRLVFKYKLAEYQIREFCNNDNQFYNELLFYERIAPFLLAHGSRRHDGGTDDTMLCRYIYGRNNCGDEWHRDVIVLENATVNGYRKSVIGHKLSLDFDHLNVALRKLAKFHGLSYKAKQKDLIKFKDTIVGVKETQWSENGDWVFHPFVLRGLFSLALDRLKERHVKSGGSYCDDNVVEWIQKFESEMLTDVLSMLKNAAVPIEPHAVLCHGDFNRNNLLFRYDDSGRPVDALPYDMATIRYGSPALDLSFFLYLNADLRTLDDHWDTLLNSYCTALAEEAGDVLVPDRDQVDAEIRQLGFLSMANLSFFTRIMLEEKNPSKPSDFFNIDKYQMLNTLIAFGGESATEWFTDALYHFLRFKYARTPTANIIANKVRAPIEI